MSKNAQKFHQKKIACFMGSSCLFQISVAPPKGGCTLLLTNTRLDQMECEQKWLKALLRKLCRQALVWLTHSLFSLTESIQKGGLISLHSRMKMT